MLVLYFEVELRAPWESSTAEGQQRNRAQRLLKKKNLLKKKKQAMKSLLAAGQAMQGLTNHSSQLKFPWW